MWKYLGVYQGLGMLTLVTLVVRSAIGVHAQVAAARRMHAALLSKARRETS